MPTVYINGGSPNYQGFEFTTTQILLEKIRDELVNAGWAISSDQIVASSQLLMRATDNSHNAYIQFRSVQTAGNTYTLRVRGDLLGNGASLSGDTLTITYEITKRNYLYLTADSAGGCLGIFNGTTGVSDPVNAMRGVHFGFLDRYDNSDQWAWMVGYLFATHHNDAYVAKSKFNDTIWRSIGADFASHSSTNTSAQAGCFQGTFDKYTVASKGAAHFDDTANTNPGRTAYQGRLNYDNLPVLGEYYYIEGRGSTTAYPGQLFFRGLVRFAITGVAAQNSGIITVSKTGRRYISTGGLAWQGFAITA